MKKSTSRSKSKIPLRDNEYHEEKIAKVSPEKSGGWMITCTDGWCFFVPKESPIQPIPGRMARFYGRGIGYLVRGLFLDGVKVFYRTVKEQEQHHLDTTYGVDAAEWLARWDAGKTVWSISMGGFGPGYEQALQIAATEILRYLLKSGIDASRWEPGGEMSAFREDRKTIEAAMFKKKALVTLGLSGAQFGAAIHLAAQLYKFGPQTFLTGSDVPEGRKIRISRDWPALPCKLDIQKWSAHLLVDVAGAGLGLFEKLQSKGISVIGVRREKGGIYREISK